MKTLLDLERDRMGMERVVRLAHRHLLLDIVYATEICGDRTVMRAQAGDFRSFTVAPGQALPAGATYSRLVVAGEIPNIIHDTAADPRVSSLPVTVSAQVGAFIGVPLRRSDGSTYGALCGMNHVPDHTLDERDVRFLTMLAELLAPDLDEQRDKEGLQAELQRLLDTEDADVAFQPIVDVRSRRCLGVEALARFPKPFDRTVDTLAAAHEVGLGLELERLIAHKVWPLLDELPPDKFLAINLTPGALVRLAPLANENPDLCLERLVVEMTEHVVVERYDEMRTLLQPLRERGLRIGVDDAGAGYASLRHVVELRPDIIKVDQSLIHGVADDHARRVAVSAFVLLAMDLDAMVIAEGVERAQDLAMLSELGVQAAQGFLLAKPSTQRRDLERWLRLPSRARPRARAESGEGVVRASSGEGRLGDRGR